MFHKQNARQPVAAALLALLLALTCAFSCIGLSSRASFRQQLAALDAQYVTVAFPIPLDPEEISHILENIKGWEGLNEGSGTWETLEGTALLSRQYSYRDPEDGTFYYGEYSSYRNPEDGTIVVANNKKIAELAESAPGLLRRDTNILAAAHTPNRKGVSSGTIEPGAYHQIYDLHRYAMSVMAVRCVHAEQSPAYGGDNSTVYRMGENWTAYRMEWVDAVCRMDAYNLPGLETGFTIYAYDSSYSCRDYLEEEKDFSFPVFEEGKTYLMRGDFLDFPYGKRLRLIEGENGESDRMEEFWQRQDEAFWSVLPADSRSEMNCQSMRFLYPSLPIRWPEDYGAEDSPSVDHDAIGRRRPVIPHFGQDVSTEAIRLADGSAGTITVPGPSRDSWPFYTEYEGDWRDFLNTEEGRVWRDEIIPACRLNHNSVPVLFTDNVQELSQFCKEESALLEGRMISPEEYETGAAVCMVSAEYARHNGLSVGDTLTLDLYKPAYSTESGFWEMGPQTAAFLYTVCMPLVPENRLNVTRDYTIVGLYSTPARPMDEDGHGFRGDTVLAPEASAPEVADAAEEDTLTPLLNTLVLENGGIDTFEAYMAENGAANRFRYYDYGYSEMKGSIEAMEHNARRLALLGGAVFLVGGAVFLLAGFARMAPAARGLRLMGARAGYVAREMLAALLPLMAAGAGIGALLGGALYGRVCEAVLSESLAVHWPILLACAALELAVLCAAACAWAWLAARRNLMRRREE